MITIIKSKKKVIIGQKYSNYDIILIEFNQEQLEQINKSKYMEYNIRNNIITNIPTNIIKIQFGGWFNMNIQTFLHPQINLLIFGFKFNLQIDNLPSKLKHLSLGASFNHQVNNLPQELHTIIFGGNFNQSIDMLPESIIYIYLSGGFNHSINNLPIGLKKLTLTGIFFKHSIDLIPDSIEILVLHPKYELEINKLPKKLIAIKFNKNIKCEINLIKLKQLTNSNIKCMN